LRWLLVVLLVPALLAACGQEPGPSLEATGGESRAAGSGESEAIGFGELLAQIRGHHLVSLELYEAGDEQGAAVHAGHPIHEILDSVSSELDETAPDIADELAEKLSAGEQAIADGAPADELAGIYAEAASITIRAEKAVVGQLVSDSSYAGSVIAAILATAGHEYEEAIGNDGVRLVAEYQDGYAFVHEARRLYDEIATEVQAAAAEEAEEIEDAFEVLAGAFASPQPPNQPTDVVEVTSASQLIGHELDETVDATLVEESDPEAIVAEIERLLDEIIETYEEGDADAAAELAAEAYLENYEVIEAEVIELAPEVNEELEPLLGADLRKQIREDASVADVEQMVVRAKDLLADALKAIA
jgi:hypothetical protein